MILDLGLGGAESMVGLLSRHLDRQRFDVEVWSLGGENETVRTLREAGLPVFTLGKPVGFAWSFLRMLRARLDQSPSHIIHAHNTPAARWAALATFERRRAPVLIRTEHTFNSSRIAEYVVSHAMMGAAFAAIVGVSDIVTMRHKRCDPLWRGRYVAIPNGIEVAPLRSTTEPDLSLRAQFVRDPSRKLILNLGNLREAKGQSYLLEAFALLASRHRDVDLGIIGEGPLRPILERSITKHLLESRVQLLGHRQDAPTLLAAGDLVVQSSIREGMPVSLLEAARMMRPIVATDVGGTREFIEGGDTGMLVPPKDVDALAKAMDQVISDPVLAHRLATRAQRRLVERHDIRTIAKRTEELYARVLRGK